MPDRTTAADVRRTAQLAATAIVLEATAPKPGNVHRSADFEDSTYLDFVIGAVAIEPAVAEAAATGRIGPAVLAGVRATQQAVGTNTNLGTLLLLAPLAAVPAGSPLADGVRSVLAGLDPDDARAVYEAIRTAHPGGLGKVDEADVSGPAPSDLVAAMQMAASRDLIARQYVNGFADVFDPVVAALQEGVAAGWPLSDTIVYAQMQLMSREPDSLIARKCGAAVAARSAAYAAQALAAGRPGEAAYHEAVSDLDFYLRADGHRRNPGTSADLIAAGLFVALRDAIIKLPIKFYAPSSE